MSRTTAVVIIAMLLVGSVGLGADSHEIKVQQIKDTLTRQRESMLRSALEADARLRGDGILSPTIEAATNVLQQMERDTAAWRDLASRTTRTHEQAKEQLNGYLKEANRQLAEAHRQLAFIADAKYKAWAQEHPDEARRRQIQQDQDDEEWTRLNPYGGGVRMADDGEWTKINPVPKTFPADPLHLSGVVIEKDGIGGARIVEVSPIVTRADGTVDGKASTKLYRMTQRMGISAAIIEEFEREKERNAGSPSDAWIDEFSRQHRVPVRP